MMYDITVTYTVVEFKIQCALYSATQQMYEHASVRRMGAYPDPANFMDHLSKYLKLDYSEVCDNPELPEPTDELIFEFRVYDPYLPENALDNIRYYFDNKLYLK